MDPNIVIAVITGTFALIATVLGLRASGRVPTPQGQTPASGKSVRVEAEELAWTIARSTMQQQQARLAEVEAHNRRLEAQLREAGLTPTD